MATSAQFYVPLLKWKRGEQQALAQLGQPERQWTRPLIDVIPESLSGDDDGARIGAYKAVVKQLGGIWGALPLFVDFSLFDTDELAPGGRQPIDLFFDLARADGLRLIPVTGPYRDAAYQAAVAAIAAVDRRGVCVRAVQDDVFEGGFNTDLMSTLTSLSLPPTDVDLIVDWGEIHQHNQGTVAMAAHSIISGLPALASWRSVTFAGSAFPTMLQGVGMILIDRTEWLAWQHLRGRVSRLVQFGDYCIAHPVYAPVPFTGSAAIRYTIDDYWLIVRGRSLRGGAYGGFSQFVALSQQLIADSRYCGRAFSWGDDYIYQCAQQTVGTGNLTTWRAVGTNHHITFVVRRLANLLAPSAVAGP